MRAWHLPQGELPTLILAADARLARLNYYDDHIWELHLNSGEPAGLTLRTTYGLRARNMRMFPRFGEGDAWVSDTAKFETPPAFIRFHPNYALVSASPFAGVDAIFEYWVAGSDHVGGRVRIFNSGVTPRRIRFEWNAALVGADESQPLAPEMHEGVHILHGRAANLAPVVFLSGGAEAQSSPSAALSLALDLQPGLSRTLIWGQGAAGDTAASFALARSFASRQWDAEVARIQMTNASQVDIETGDPAWDAAFALGQAAARRLLHGPTPHLPHTSFVHTRLPDQGYSLRGDGSDYDHLWNGQNVLETWHLTSQFLPGEPALAQGLLDNFLAAQQPDGAVDWQPSLNGRRSGTLATPMLCSLAWRVHQLTHDQVYLIKTFPRLQKFINHWFAEAHDHDGNGVPEWDHPMQTGYEDNPLFAHWQPWAQGADISQFESPSLTALLHREIDCLKQIARAINYAASIPALEEKQARLRESLLRAWDPAASLYRYLDWETHTSNRGGLLVSRKGASLINLPDPRFDPPARLSIRLRREGEGARDPRLTILGVGGGGDPAKEEIPPEGVRWSLGWGTVISRHAYREITFVQVEGILPDDEVQVHALDYRHLDQTLLAPLWAGAADPEQAEGLVKKTVIHPLRFWRRYGLAACATRPDPEAADLTESVWIPWNCMVGEGLLRYGYREAAAELVTRLMDAITANLKQGGAFRRHHHAGTGEGLGERDAALGLPPLDLFLAALGVRIDSIWRVGLRGRNPFPWEVTVKFRGLIVRRGLESTEVTFPSGESVIVAHAEPCVVEGKPQQTLLQDSLR
jgi:hypothetical protein